MPRLRTLLAMLPRSDEMLPTVRTMMSVTPPTSSAQQFADDLGPDLDQPATRASPRQ